MAARSNAERAAIIRSVAKDDPIKRVRRDPFVAGLDERERRARLEGRKLMTSRLWAGEIMESMYRVDYYRRYIDRGNSSSTLVEFFGPRARRRYKPGEPKPDWEVTDPEGKRHVVEVHPSIKVK